MQSEATMVYWCLGSNIDAERHIRFAVCRFLQDFDQVGLSKLYRCPAVGFEGDDFLNLALSLETRQSPQELIEYANQLERSAGRVRVSRGRYDSRTLDVDLVMYGDLCGLHYGRAWPSNDINEAAHVLRPMVDIAPNKYHPVSGKTFYSLWNEFVGNRSHLTQVGDVW